MGGGGGSDENSPGRPQARCAETLWRLAGPNAGQQHLWRLRISPVVNFIEECVAFPNGTHDDQVDAMTRALLRWHMAQPEIVVYRLPTVQISPI